LIGPSLSWNCGRSVMFSTACTWSRARLK
jgi:hypothetical protein